MLCKLGNGAVRAYRALQIAQQKLLRKVRRLEVAASRPLCQWHPYLIAERRARFIHNNAHITNRLGGRSGGNQQHAEQQCCAPCLLRP